MAKTPIGNVKGVGIKNIVFTSSDKGSVPGIAGATDTYTINYENGSTNTVYNGKDGAAIDDTSTSEDTVWSSSKVDREKVGHFSNTFVTMTGQAANATIGVGEFLSALASKYGNKAYINGVWASDSKGYVTDGTVTVEINGGLLLFSATGATETPFPNGVWQYAEVVYFPTASDSVLNKIYKFVGRVSGTAGTTDIEKIYVFSGQTT